MAFGDLCYKCGKSNRKRERGFTAAVATGRQWFCSEKCLKAGQDYSARQGGECMQCRDKCEEAGSSLCNRCKQEMEGMGGDAPEFVG